MAMTEPMQTEKLSTQDAESEFGRAKEMLASMIAKRDEAAAALKVAEEKRRSVARSILMGNTDATKAKKAATAERDDAARLLEDIELVVQEAEAAVKAAQIKVHDQQFRQLWSEMLALGARRAEQLGKMASARDAFFAAYVDYRRIGLQILPLQGKTTSIPSALKLSFDPIRVAGFIGGDNDRVSALLIDTMPSDLFMRLPHDRSMGRCTDAADSEMSFWASNELDDDAASAE
jgi:hypothetical protein